MRKKLPGCFTEYDLTPNELEIARCKALAEGGYLDLTSSNPTQQGLLFPPTVLRQAAEGYWESRRYTPDPQGLPAARAAIAQFYAERSPPFLVKEEALFLTASTSEAYGLLFALLADAGDNLLIPNVTYPLFEYLAAIHHLELKTYLLDEEKNWQIDEESLLAQVDSQTRAILLVSPHNPTGMVIQNPLAVFDKLGLPLICDEVFATFPYAIEAIPPIAALHPQLPVFTLNGISKMFALPDLKLGWILLNSVAQTLYSERLELLNDTFLGANSLIQTMLPQLFAQGNAFRATMHEQIRANLTLGLDSLRSCPGVKVQAPAGGYYLFPLIQTWENEDELVLYLLQKGVLVHPGYFYGEVSGVHIMLSALTAPASFEQGLACLVQALRA